jgi:hypothetical protein
VIPNISKAVATAPVRRRYMDDAGGMQFSYFSQSDFVYVPTVYAHQFASHANWMVENEIMLEVGMPTILARLHKLFKANVQNVSLCTEFDYWKRARPKTWIYRCLKETYTTYHPVKLSVEGKLWDSLFDKVVLGK